jgi:hypothetical protein
MERQAMSLMVYIQICYSAITACLAAQSIGQHIKLVLDILLYEEDNVISSDDGSGDDSEEDTLP